MNDFILERYYKLLDERASPKTPTKTKSTISKKPTNPTKPTTKPTNSTNSSNSSKPTKPAKPKKPESTQLTKEEIERQDELMAIRLLKSEIRGPITRRGGPAPKVVKKKATRNSGAALNSPFNAEHGLSSQLQAVVGEKRMSRPQVVKHIWAYIKANELQDPKDKRNVLCDDTLQAVFKKLVVGMFEMNKILGNHLFKDDDIVKNEKVVKDLESEEIPEEEAENEVKVEKEVKGEVELESEISDVDD